VNKFFSPRNMIFKLPLRILLNMRLTKDFNKGKIDKFHYEIRKQWLFQDNQFGNIFGFYQTHPELNIQGYRPTLSRINNYGLLNYLCEGDEVLDIGGNVGFFSMYLSKFVKSVDVVEMNNDLVNIGLKTRDYLKIKNVEFFNEDIRSFKSDKKYDLVLTMAVHGHLGISLDQYLELVSNLVAPNGKILIESHLGEDTALRLLSQLKELNKEIVNSGFTDDHLGLIRGFYIIKN